ncbi:MAG: hypothetical protein GTO49_26170, partial [Anaerolineae bacterium]|nr:hypothetical protein [Anaerolineae bacterium]
LISSVVSGLFLSAYSVVSEPRLVAQETTAGTAANGVSFEDLGFSGYGLIESSLTVDLCGVSFYFLNEDEAEQYNDTGELPAPDLHCEKT